ncbi:MISP protein, partial [Herpetotheres cachinnans]|nr:MISP protein [Herpetotheres cachinnans]
DEDEEEQYRVPPPNISPEKARELEDERRDVIQSQVMRKSSTIAERWSSMDELSSISAGTGSQGEGRCAGSFTTSFAICFDKPSSGRAVTPVDAENIDTGQINFSAARQQFLMLEKTSPGSFLSPGQQAMSPKPDSTTKISRQGSHSPEVATKAARGYSNDGTSNQSKTDKTVYQGYNVSYKTRVKEEEMKINETPIEREIRMAMEREENLWKERGIQRLTSSSELVEIQTKPLLSIHTSPSPGRKGKDKGRASLYVQREIEQETKREEDLKKQGRLLGTYDRGTQQELGERRRVFEQEEAPPQKPTPTSKADERRSWVNEFAAEQPTSHSPCPAEDTRRGRSLPGYATSIVHFQASQPHFATSEKSWEQPLVSQHVSASASKWGSKDSQGGRLPGSTLSPAGTAVLPREHFFFSFWKPKVSFVDNMGTQNPLRRDEGREEQYKLRTWKPQTSALIEEEIRSDLQREEELQEQRRRRLIDGYSLVSSDDVPQEGPRSRHSSGKGRRGTVGWDRAGVSPGGRDTAGNAPALPFLVALSLGGSHLRGQDMETLTPDSARSSPFEERRRRVKEDGKYAGIEPVDKINTEVVESTRVIRHKSAMAQRWEAGQYVRDDD